MIVFSSCCLGMVQYILCVSLFSVSLSVHACVFTWASMEMARSEGSQTTAVWICLRWNGKIRMTRWDTCSKCTLSIITVTPPLNTNMMFEICYVLCAASWEMPWSTGRQGLSPWRWRRVLTKGWVIHNSKIHKRTQTSTFLMYPNGEPEKILAGRILSAMGLSHLAQ